jgi:hypothetical protein
VGATPAQVCYALYINGIEYIEKFVKQVDNWLDGHGCKSLGEIRGILGTKTHEERKVFDCAAYEVLYTEEIILYDGWSSKWAGVSKPDINRNYYLVSY